MSIHQEAVIDATPLELYAYLTDGETFGAATGMATRLEARAGSPGHLGPRRLLNRAFHLDGATSLSSETAKASVGFRRWACLARLVRNWAESCGDRPSSPLIECSSTSTDTSPATR